MIGMSDQRLEGFLPTAYAGSAWDEARTQLARPRKGESPLEGMMAGMGVRDLLNRYMYTIDQGDLDGLMGFFTDDCVINTPKGSIVGTAAIREHYDLLLTGPHRRFHLVTNMIVRLADDYESGRITSYYFAMLQNDGQPPRAVAGLLADQVVKHGGGWKISARSISTDVTCEFASVLAKR